MDFSRHSLDAKLPIHLPPYHPPSRLPAALANLPAELLLEIGQHLDVPSLSRLSRSSRKFYHQLDSEVTKRASDHALAPRVMYETNFNFSESQQHGVDIPTLRPRWSLGSLEERFGHRRRTSAPDYCPWVLERFGRVVHQGKRDAVQNLLDRGLSPDAYLVCGARMLSIAVEQGHMEVAKLLLERGARACLPDPGRYTSPLDRAAQKGDIEMVQLLISADPAVNSCICLHRVIFYRRDVAEVLTPLIDPATFNHVEGVGRTALHQAMLDGHSGTAMHLIGLPGIDLNAQDADGWAPLHFALHRPLLVQALLEAGAAINVTLPGGGDNVLHVALSSALPEDPVGLGQIQMVPLRVVTNDLLAVVLLLLRHGAEVNGVSARGTPMHCAVRLKSLTLVNMLLTESPTPVDLTIQDQNGHDAVELAAARGLLMIAHVLRQASLGQDPDLGILSGASRRRRSWQAG
ncbi:hypothetical protein PDE_09375 [Penicillium oxalicum 114-2]|uniref:F-box domain-containing protein n=1 Tax=Penicillium oxalicum (strain 114-2 / CGMCC 5302) TaxID=933388 RepID=S8A001_PENO1|nr:hypothetical protein PDE_09375 [Penicillium oxalicum 114-2]